MREDELAELALEQGEAPRGKQQQQQQQQQQPADLRRADSKRLHQRQTRGSGRRRTWMVCGAAALLLSVVGVTLAVVLARQNAAGKAPGTRAALSIAFADGRFLVAKGPQGVHVLDDSGELLRKVAPRGIDSVDLVAAADGLLFAADFRELRLATLGLEDGGEGALLASAEAPQRTFSSIAAGHRRVVVSGGTLDLSLFTLPEDGSRLDRPQRLDLGAGQPAVHVDAARDLAYVSTDFSSPVGGKRFGVTVVDISSGLEPLARVGLTSDAALLDDSRPVAPFFALRCAAHGARLAVAWPEGVAILDVTEAASPRQVGFLSAAELGLSPRDVAVDASSGAAYVLGPTSRDAPSGQWRLRALDLVEQTVAPRAPSPSVRGAVLGGLAAGAGAVAVASTDGDVFFFRAADFFDGA